jgi:hypothetical protein
MVTVGIANTAGRAFCRSCLPKATSRNKTNRCYALQNAAPELHSLLAFRFNHEQKFSDREKKIESRTLKTPVKEAASHLFHSSFVCSQSVTHIPPRSF